jgi:polyisoprenoid-binding protein YceI
MKVVFSLMVLLLCVLSFRSIAQQVYFTRTGRIDFHAGTSLEDIDAINNEVTSVLDVSKGELAFSVLIKSFHFRRSLMEEHFNENYLESNKYPKSTFKGRIVNKDKVKFTENGTYTAQVEGDLTIHGVTNPVSSTATFTVDGKQIKAGATFMIKVNDYKIEIPGVVADNISRQVSIAVQCIYEPRN